MRFQGLDPRTRWLRWGLVAVAVGIVIGTTGPRSLNALLTTWDTNRAILPWVFERLFAFLAYTALTASVVYGLLLSTKLLDAIARPPITFALHQDLASVGLGLAAVHGMLLGLDQTVPFTLAQIAVPGKAPYAPVWVATGQVRVYLMAIVVGSFYVRRHIGQRAWRTLHYVSSLPSPVPPSTASSPERTAPRRGPGGCTSARSSSWSSADVPDRRLGRWRGAARRSQPRASRIPSAMTATVVRLVA